MDSINKSTKVITFCAVSFCSRSSQPPKQGNLTSLAVAVRERENLIKTPKPKYSWSRRRSTVWTPLLTTDAEVEYNNDNKRESDDERDHEIDGEGDCERGSEGHWESDKEGLGQVESNEGVSEREKM